MAADNKVKFTDKEHIKHVYSAMNEVEKERFGLFRETNFQDAQIKKVSL